MGTDGHMNWSLTRVSEPESPLVSLSDAKVHLRVDHDADDVLILQVVDAATERFEDYQNRSFVTQQWRLTLGRFPRGRIIYLPRPPVSAIDKIEYITPAGDVEEMTTGDYRISESLGVNTIVLTAGRTWPRVADEPDAVRITYTAGYGNAEDVPEAVSAAVLLLSGHLYENREVVTVGTGPTFRLPMSSEYLLAPNRVFHIDPFGGR